MFNAHEPFRRGAGKDFPKSPRALSWPYMFLKLSFPLQVWIWDRVTQPPAGKIPYSCSSPSFSFSGCSVFELCLLPAHLQLEENQYWESCAGLSLLLDHPLTSMTHLCLLSVWEAVTSLLKMGVPAALYCCAEAQIVQPGGQTGPVSSSPLSQSFAFPQIS